MGYMLSRDELEQQLAEQMAIMRRTAQAFDEGHEYEAKQLAARIRLLVHDTGSSHSLLGQLGLKDGMRFEDSTLRLLNLPPGAIVLHSGITITQMRLGGSNAGVAFAAPLDDLPPGRMGPPVEFEQWWEPVILTDQQGNEFSRRSFVLALANQDGGTHVDPELRPGYAALVKENSDLPLVWQERGRSRTRAATPAQHCLGVRSADCTRASADVGAGTTGRRRERSRFFQGCLVE